MKKLLILLLFYCAVVKASTLPTNSVTSGITLSWSYPTNGITDDLRFVIYSTTNVTTPWQQWSSITNIAATNFIPYQIVFDGTNWMATNLIIRCDIPPAQYYFVGTATNFWGESSITSNLTFTPPTPLVINDSIRIRK